MKAVDRIPKHRSASGLEPTYVTLGETLCRVRFWTEQEWDALDPACRPAEAVHKPGVGWAAPVPSVGPC